MQTTALIPEVEKKFTPYLSEMIDIHKKNLISVNIYGSAAGSDYSPRISDINSVFIFKEINFSAIQNSLYVIRQGHSRRIATPLFLTQEYIQTSTDVFPIEFLDMKENHLVVFGKDILAELIINQEHLRLFCEQQIKGKLIRIREAYLEVGLNHKKIQKVLTQSLNSLIPVFRNLIRLKGKTPPISKIKILEQFSNEYNLRKDVFLSVYERSRQNIENLPALFEEYMTQLQMLSQQINKSQ